MLKAYPNLNEKQIIAKLEENMVEYQTFNTKLWDLLRPFVEHSCSTSSLSRDAECCPRKATTTTCSSESAVRGSH